MDRSESHTVTEQPPDLDQNGRPIGAPPDLDVSGKPPGNAPYVPDSPLAHHLNEQEGGGDWGQNLADAGQPFAHPQTAGDLAGLLIPSGGAEAIGKVLRPVGQTISKYGGAAAKLAGTAATTMLPPAMVTPARAAMKVLGELKPSEWNSPLTVAGREGRAHAAVADQVERYLPNKGGMPTSTTVTPSSRIPYATPTEATPVAGAPTVASGGLSDADKALLAKKYPGLDPVKVERHMMGDLQPIAPAGRPPITVSPESPMQEPRAQIGAEVVGRQNGMTTQQVRDATGPIRGEAPGQAAGMPSQPKDRIIQKLIDMGPKGQGLPEAEREAYAAAGTSDKTRLQVQAYLDALRKMGAVGVAATAPSLMRNTLVSGIHDQQ